jgi:nicotinate-nucleotide pyrophosphorylase (carboxylating)
MNFDEQLQHLVVEALKEDIGDGDHSTLSSIATTEKGKAVLKIKQDGILAGIDVARKIFLFKEPNAVFIPFKNDGDEMCYGENALR